MLVWIIDSRANNIRTLTVHNSSSLTDFGAIDTLRDWCNGSSVFISLSVDWLVSLVLCILSPHFLYYLYALTWLFRLVETFFKFILTNFGSSDQIICFLYRILLSIWRRRSGRISLFTIRSSCISTSILVRYLRANGSILSFSNQMVSWAQHFKFVKLINNIQSVSKNK
jgi:hypothetical protein